MLPRFFCHQTSRFFSVPSLLQTNTPLFLPFYHLVSDQKLPHIQNYPYRNSREFEKELDFFLQYFEPVSLAEILENPQPKKKVFHLSFDDGLKECAEIIAPILLRKGIPATFFVNTAFVNNQALFHKYKASLLLNKLRENGHPKARQRLREAGINTQNILRCTTHQAPVLDEVAELLAIDFNEFLHTRQPYLTTSQLLDLQNKGFSIGAHSCNHPEFWTISAAEQLDQIRKSMAWINENVQPKIKAFAFPYTDNGVSQQVFETIQHDNICDITFGTAGLKYDTVDTHLQRYPIEMPGDFVQNIKTEWLYFLLRKWINKASVKH